MIPFNRYLLNNGLRLLHHHDTMTQMVAVNLLYDVGSRDEQPGKTGLAHLVEHLMFSGSKNAPRFDDPLQAAGGECNAWTSVDMTNYYEVLPSQNIETAFWLERDRMINLTLTPTSVTTQRSVVCEEFKQRCTNQPYGDLQHVLHALAYTTHPYRWPTLGLTIDEVAALTLDDVAAFRGNHYAVDNMVMCVSGNIAFEHAVQLAEKWFGDLAPRHRQPRRLPVEPEQTTHREVTVHRNVPNDLLCVAFPMCRRTDTDFVVCDLMSDLLANGTSARFTRNILAQTDIFTELDASVGGTTDNGLFVIRGKLTEGASVAQALDQVFGQLDLLERDGEVTEHEIEKCANKFESTSRFESLGYLPKAMRLCRCELLGDAALTEHDCQRYRTTTPDDVRRVAKSLFAYNHSNVVNYLRSQ